MKLALAIFFAISNVFVFIFAIIGWRAFCEKLPFGVTWMNNDVIPSAFCLAVIVLPFYLSPPKELADWLRRARKSEK